MQVCGQFAQIPHVLFAKKWSNPPNTRTVFKVDLHYINDLRQKNPLVSRTLHAAGSGVMKCPRERTTLNQTAAARLSCIASISTPLLDSERG